MLWNKWHAVLSGKFRTRLIIGSIQELELLATPRLKRFMLWNKWHVVLRDKFQTRFIIGSIQELKMLGT
jgi:hypothetical protein